MTSATYEGTCPECHGEAVASATTGELVCGRCDVRFDRLESARAALARQAGQPPREGRRGRPMAHELSTVSIGGEPYVVVPAVVCPCCGGDELTGIEAGGVVVGLRCSSCATRFVKAGPSADTADEHAIVALAHRLALECWDAGYRRAPIAGVEALRRAECELGRRLGRESRAFGRAVRGAIRAMQRDEGLAFLGSQLGLDLAVPLAGSCKSECPACALVLGASGGDGFGPPSVYARERCSLERWPLAACTAELAAKIARNLSSGTGVPHEVRLGAPDHAVAPNYLAAPRAEVRCDGVGFFEGTDGVRDALLRKLARPVGRGVNALFDAPRGISPDATHTSAEPYNVPFEGRRALLLEPDGRASLHREDCGVFLAASGATWLESVLGGAEFATCLRGAGEARACRCLGEEAARAGSERTHPRAAPLNGRAPHGKRPSEGGCVRDVCGGPPEAAGEVTETDARTPVGARKSVGAKGA